MFQRYGFIVKLFGLPLGVAIGITGLAGPAMAPKIGCIAQTLSGWVKLAEKDSGMRDGVTTEERHRIKAL